MLPSCADDETFPVPNPNFWRRPAATKKRTGKYSKAASKKVGKVLHEQKRGGLRSGSGKKVKSRKQAIAIGLSEARRRGKKVPPRPSA